MSRRVGGAATAALTLLIGLADCGGRGPASGATPTPTASGVAAPVVVDTDMSWDDIVALVYLLRRSDLDIKAIAVAGDGLTHCAPGVTHVRELVAYLRHAPVPVACGRQEPLAGSAAFPAAWRKAADGFFGLTLPPTDASASNETAEQLLYRALLVSPNTVVISLGPMTDLADALAQHPELRQQIKMIYAMAGALDVPGNEPEHGLAEWNVYVDPSAAELVLGSRAPITLVPLDASDDAPVTVLFRGALDAGKAPGASKVVSSLLADPYYYTGSQYFWDPVTAVTATNPSLARFSSEWITVVEADGADRGRTIRASGGHAVRAAVGVDAQAFYQEYLRIVMGDPQLKFKVPPSHLDIAYSGRWTIHDAVHAAVEPMAVSITNNTSLAVGIVVARVTGHTVSDVDAAIQAGVTSPPSWFQIVLQVSVPQGHPATWGIDLQSGLYVVVGGGPTLPLQRLAAVRVP